MTQQQLGSCFNKFVQVRDNDGPFLNMDSSTFLKKPGKSIQRFSDEGFRLTMNTMKNCESLSLASILGRRMSLEDNSEQDDGQHCPRSFSIDTSEQRNGRTIQTGTKRNLTNLPGAIDEKRQKRRKRMHRSKKIKAATKMAAVFYGECYLRGIGHGKAEAAAEKSHSEYKKWWLQEFSPNNLGSLGDSFLVPKFRQTLHPLRSHYPKMIDNLMKETPRQDKNSCESSKVHPSLLQETFEDSQQASMKMNESVYYTVTNDDYSSRFPLEKTNHNLKVVHNSILSKNTSLKTNSSTVEDYIPPNRNLSSKISRQVDNFKKIDSSCHSTLKVPIFEPLEEDTTNLDQTANSSILRPKPLKPKILPYQKMPSLPSTNSNLNAMNLDRTRFENSERLERMETLEKLTKSIKNNHEHDNDNLLFHKQNSFCERLDEAKYLSEKDDYEMTRGGKCTWGRDTTYKYEERIHSSKNDIIPTLKMKILHELACTGGDVTDKKFLNTLEQLRTCYQMTGWDTCTESNRRYCNSNQRKIEGMWLTLSRPHFPGCLGRNTEGDYLYTLGRMSFDMFRPVDLVCSLNGMFNSIVPQSPEKIKSIPKSLREEVQQNNGKLRSYDIITAFTIEPESLHFGKNSSNNSVIVPVRGIMTVYAHILPDPKTPNRFTVWFTGGEMKANNSVSDQKEWNRIFGGILPKRNLSEMARILAAKLLLGAHVPEKMDDDGKMRFNFDRPIGGHGVAYIDTLYLDESLCITQGHRGSIYVHMRTSSSAN